MYCLVAGPGNVSTATGVHTVLPGHTGVHWCQCYQGHMPGSGATALASVSSTAEAGTRHCPLCSYHHCHCVAWLYRVANNLESHDIFVKIMISMVNLLRWMIQYQKLDQSIFPTLLTETINYILLRHLFHCRRWLYNSTGRPGIGSQFIPENYKVAYISYLYCTEKGKCDNCIIEH